MPAAKSPRSVRHGRLSWHAAFDLATSTIAGNVESLKRRESYRQCVSTADKSTLNETARGARTEEWLSMGILSGDVVLTDCRKHGDVNEGQTERRVDQGG